MNRRLSKLTRALLFALACASTAAAEDPSRGTGATATEAPAPPDPRVGEAAALLDAKDDWPRAIALYEAVLAEDPANLQARLGAARVHAWSGNYDAALAHFDALLAASEPPATAEIERAEVLSWSGRTTEAAAAFDAILARDPNNARALRGLARSYRWSNQYARADRAYLQSLEIEENGDARRELDAMRIGPRWLAENDTTYFSDSDQFHLYRSETSLSRKLDYDTRVRARVRAAKIDFNGRSDQLGFAATLGVERRFAHQLRAAIDLGGLEWNHARDRFTGRAELGWIARTQSSLTFAVAHGDLLAYTADVDAVQAGLASTSLRASIWQPFTRAWSAYAYGDYAFFSDDNHRRAVGASLDYQPWQERELLFSVGVDWTGYSRDSALYYDPDGDFSAVFAARYTQPLGLGLEVWIRPSVGYGWASQDAASGDSANWSIQGGPTWRHASGFWLGLDGHYSKSQRANGYSHHGAAVSIGREF
jgi:Tfp pilus assembly protein PilF